MIKATLSDLLLRSLTLNGFGGGNPLDSAIISPGDK